MVRWIRKWIIIKETQEKPDRLRFAGPLSVYNNKSPNLSTKTNAIGTKYIVIFI